MPELTQLPPFVFQMMQWYHIEMMKSYYGCSHEAAKDFSDYNQDEPINQKKSKSVFTPKKTSEDDEQVRNQSKDRS